MKEELLTVNDFITQNPELISARPLLALSGGVDSMVLADLLLKSNINFSAAHCNFGLRGKDADDDEEFVKKFCEHNQIELFTKRFDVKTFKKSGNYSTQMAARELRYNWFEELIAENKFDYLLTAHHLDDVIETFIINLSRGTGINGLKGIKRKNQTIFRPLLNYSKQTISDYAKNIGLEWREDQSNSETDYIRNKIRHKILPVLNELHPRFKANFSKTVDQLNDDAEIIKNHIEELRNKLFIKKDDQILISIDELKKLKPLSGYIFHLFSDYGFHTDEVVKLFNSKNNGQLLTEEYRLIKNRAELIIVANSKSDYNHEIDINQGQIIEKPIYLKVSKSGFKDSNASETFDCEKIEFPLRLRKPKTGDSFRPLGMKGDKKLSKFFKDEKYSMIEKEKAWILTDRSDKILCILGKRMDERFKITEHTQFFLNIYLC